MSNKLRIILLIFTAALLMVTIVVLFLWGRKYKKINQRIQIDTLQTNKKIEKIEKRLLHKYKTEKVKKENTRVEKTINEIEKRYLAMETIPEYDTTKALFTTSTVYIKTDYQNDNVKKCIIKAYIDPNGNVVNVTIFSSSGNKEMDNKALLEVKSMFFPIYNFKVKGTFPWILVPVEFK